MELVTCIVIILFVTLIIFRYDYYIIIISLPLQPLVWLQLSENYHNGLLNIFI